MDKIKARQLIVIPKEEFEECFQKVLRDVWISVRVPKGSILKRMKVPLT